MKRCLTQSCIYLFLTNSSKCFEDCLASETGVSNFHKIIVTVMETKHEPFPPKIVKYWDYPNFDTKVFNCRNQLTLENTTPFEELKEIFMDLLNKFALLKHVMRCAIWYHLYNLKNVKNTHGEVLNLVKFQAKACNFTKINTHPWVFFTFLKFCERYQIAQCITCKHLRAIHSKFIGMELKSVQNGLVDFNYFLL